MAPAGHVPQLRLVLHMRLLVLADLATAQVGAAAWLCSAPHWVVAAIVAALGVRDPREELAAHIAAGCPVSGPFAPGVMLRAVPERGSAASPDGSPVVRLHWFGLPLSVEIGREHAVVYGVDDSTVYDTAHDTDITAHDTDILGDVVAQLRALQDMSEAALERLCDEAGHWC